MMYLNQIANQIANHIANQSGVKCALEEDTSGRGKYYE